MKGNYDVDFVAVGSGLGWGGSDFAWVVVSPNGEALNLGPYEEEKEALNMASWLNYRAGTLTLEEYRVIIKDII